MGLKVSINGSTHAVIQAAQRRYFTTWFFIDFYCYQRRSVKLISIFALSHELPCTRVFQRKTEVSNLMGTFVSELVGLMGSLVQGWTKLQPTGASDMAQQFGSFAQGLASSKPTSSRPVGRVTRSAVAANMCGRSSDLVDSPPNIDRDVDVDGIRMDDVRPDGESSDDEIIGDFVLAARKKIRDSNEDVPVSDYDTMLPDYTAPPDVPPRTVVGNVCVESFNAKGSAHLDDDSTHAEPNDPCENNAPPIKNGVDLAVGASTLEVPDSRNTEAQVVYKRRIQTVGQKHSAITNIVTSELGLSAPTMKAAYHDKQNDKPKAKKMTPRRYDHPFFLESFI